MESTVEKEPRRFAAGEFVMWRVNNNAPPVRAQVLSYVFALGQYVVVAEGTKAGVLANPADLSPCTKAVEVEVMEKVNQHARNLGMTEDQISQAMHDAKAVVALEREGAKILAAKRLAKQYKQKAWDHHILAGWNIVLAEAAPLFGDLAYAMPKELPADFGKNPLAQAFVLSIFPRPTVYPKSTIGLIFTLQSDGFYTPEPDLFLVPSWHIVNDGKTKSLVNAVRRVPTLAEALVLSIESQFDHDAKAKQIAHPEKEPDA